MAHLCNSCDTPRSDSRPAFCIYCEEITETYEHDLDADSRASRESHERRCNQLRTIHAMLQESPVTDMIRVFYKIDQHRRGVTSFTRLGAAQMFAAWVEGEGGRARIEETNADVFELLSR